MNGNQKVREYAMQVISDPDCSPDEKFRAIGALVDGLYEEVGSNPINWIPAKHRGKAAVFGFTWFAAVSIVFGERLLQLFREIPIFLP